MPYISCQHAMPHFEIFNENNDVVLPGFFATEREALEFLLDSAAELSSIDAKFYHIGHACLDHDEWEHGTCQQHKTLLAGLDTVLNSLKFEATFEESEGYEYPAQTYVAPSYDAALGMAREYARLNHTRVHEVVNVF